MLLASRGASACCRHHSLRLSARCLVFSTQHQRPHIHNTTSNNSTRAVQHAPAATAAAATAAAAPPPIDQEHQQQPTTIAGLSFADRPGVWDNSSTTSDSTSSKLLLKNLTFDELAEWCASMGECCVV